MNDINQQTFINNNDHLHTYCFDDDMYLTTIENLDKEIQKCALVKQYLNQAYQKFNYQKYLSFKDKIDILTTKLSSMKDLLDMIVDVYYLNDKVLYQDFNDKFINNLFIETGFQDKNN